MALMPEYLGWSSKVVGLFPWYRYRDWWTWIIVLQFNVRNYKVVLQFNGKNYKTAFTIQCQELQKWFYNSMFGITKVLLQFNVRNYKSVFTFQCQYV